jgi:hypothetical protein
MSHAAELRVAGVTFVYHKHPIWRTGHIRKRELREKWEAVIAERASKSAPAYTQTGAR